MEFFEFLRVALIEGTHEVDKLCDIDVLEFTFFSLAKEVFPK